MKTALLALLLVAGAQEPPARKIFAIGGWRTSKEGLPLMKFFIGLTGKPNPKVCLLPTASGDNAEGIVGWYDVMNQLDCRPRHLRLFQPSKVESWESVLLDMDAIYVGGGTTLNMLAIWRDQGVDALLRKAYEKGIVIGGVSAGAICWFAQGCTDSRPGKLGSMDGLGWLPGSAVPHYSDEKRRTATAELLMSGALKDGLALDEGVGALFENEKRTRVVSSLPKSKAYEVRRQGGATPLETEVLP